MDKVSLAWLEQAKARDLLDLGAFALEMKAGIVSARGNEAMNVVRLQVLSGYGQVLPIATEWTN